jgi:hypothetical protein
MKSERQMQMSESVSFLFSTDLNQSLLFGPLHQDKYTGYREVHRVVLVLQSNLPRCR